MITSQKNSRKTLVYKKLGYKVLLIDKLENKKDFIMLYKKIYKIGYSRMLVEAGLTFLNSLIKNKMIHELYIFKSYKKLSKNGKNNDTSRYLKKIDAKLLTINLNDDKLLKKEFYNV